MSDANDKWGYWFTTFSGWETAFDRCLKISEAAVVIAITAVLILLVGREVHWIWIASDPSTRQQRIEAALRMGNDNWKIGLLILIPLFYLAYRYMNVTRLKVNVKSNPIGPVVLAHGSEQGFPWIASQASRTIIGRSNSAAQESAHETLNIALTTSPPNAIKAKYPHIELWTASAFNAPLLVFAASVFFWFESQGMTITAPINSTMPK